MANRRGLKKDLNYLYSGLMLDAFAAFTAAKKADDEKTSQLCLKISDNFSNFVKRVSCTDGKDNPKVVKAYYKKLWDDILKDVLAISKEIDEIK